MAFIARGNDDVRAFSLLAMVESLFETGYLAIAAACSRRRPVTCVGQGWIAVRLADAFRRGVQSAIG